MSTQPRKTVPGISHSQTGRLTTFDIVVTDQDEERFVAIEVSFQVTTNSVIERKAGQAKSRYDQMEERGFKIAYVLDGSGNFERRAALQTILEHSHCSVAFADSELNILVDFLTRYFGG